MTPANALVLRQDGQSVADGCFSCVHGSTSSKAHAARCCVIVEVGEGCLVVTLGDGPARTLAVLT